MLSQTWGIQVHDQANELNARNVFSGTAELIAAVTHKKIVASKETVHQKTLSLSLTLSILYSTDGTRRLILRQQRESDQQKIKILLPFQRIWLMKIRLIIALMQTTYVVVKLKPENNSGLNGIQTHDLCDTSAVLYKLSYQANWELIILWVRNIPVNCEECRSQLAW